MSETLLAFKAGRSFRREGTNFVDANPTKGAVYLQNEDGLLHLKWQNRTTQEFEEDLILFPQDASFSKVKVPGAGRTYMLKFSSSNQRHFFWMQSESSARDDEFANNVNAILSDPEAQLEWSQPTASTSQQASGSAAGPSRTGQPREEDLARIRELIASMGPGRTRQQLDVSLIDILTPETLTPLFTTHPTLIPALFPHLPPDLPTPPSPSVLQEVIQSPQFQAAVRNFDQALRTGLLGGLVRGLGLPEEAGTGVGPFLRAVQEQARREGGEGGSGSSQGQSEGGGQDRMETD